MVFCSGRFDITAVCYANGAKRVEHFTDVFDEENPNACRGIYSLQWKESAEDPIQGSFVSCGEAVNRAVAKWREVHDFSSRVVGSLSEDDDEFDGVTFGLEWITLLRRHFFASGEVDRFNTGLHLEGDRVPAAVSARESASAFASGSWAEALASAFLSASLTSGTGSALGSASALASLLVPTSSLSSTSSSSSEAMTETERQLRAEIDRLQRERPERPHYFTTSQSQVV